MPLKGNMTLCWATGLKGGLWRSIMAAVLLFSGPLALANDSDDYQPMAGVDGKIRSVGSGTMANLMTLWGEAFKRYYPHIKIEVQAAGSSTAPPALTEGVAAFGPMSRELKPSEIAYFTRKHGYPPTALKVAMDAIILFTDHSNPVVGLSTSDVDAIFSVTRFCGGKQAITRWHQLGVEADVGQRPITLFGRNSISGTYGLFKQRVLCGGDFKPQVQELPSSASVLKSVAYSEGALGYAAFGYRTGVKVLPIAPPGGEYVEATVDNIAAGAYPFGRFLYLVINKHPQQPLSVLEREFLLFILSQSGQRQVQRDGYVAVPAGIIQRQLRQISG